MKPKFKVGDTVIVNREWSKPYGIATIIRIYTYEASVRFKNFPDYIDDETLDAHTLDLEYLKLANSHIIKQRLGIK